jgi:hypothetical protein
MRTNGLKVVAAVAALGVAGCGGSSNKALSYGDFSKKADAICAANQKDIAATGAKLTGRASTDAPAYDQVISKVQGARDQFGKLKPPDQLKPSFDSFLSTTDQQIAGAKEAQAAAKTGDDAAYQAVLRKLAPLSKQSKAEGSKLGAPACAK